MILLTLLTKDYTYLCNEQKHYKMKNTKKIIVEIPNEKVLNLIKKTPALNRLFRGALKVGCNEQTVNHKQYSDIQRIIGVIGCKLINK